jgi:RNA recognition motif-containing protein
MPIYQEEYLQRQPEPSYRGMPALSNQPNYAFEAQTWGYQGASNNGAGMGMGGTGRVKAPNTRGGGRAPLPPTWLEQAPPQNQGLNNFQMDYNHPQMMAPYHNHQSPPPTDSDELIPTAIVIKNIPFAIRKEELIAIMTDMAMPLPYAFNYHFDNGVFRGLAFANFTTSEETAMVINKMNNMTVKDRKLRVEYKRMLPAHERERIEREKRQKRGQLQEQHQPIPPGQVQNPLHPRSSMTSLGSGQPPASPSPVSFRQAQNPNYQSPDLNDPQQLEYYNQLMLFKANQERSHLVFDSTKTPTERAIIHMLAHHMNLEHRSEGQGDSRCVVVTKRDALITPPVSQLPQSFAFDSTRRVLNRAATCDFGEYRETLHGHSLARQTSGMLDIPASPGLNGLSAPHNLRAAKSFADLRSYSPSPSQSNSGFPSSLAQTAQKFITDHNQSTTGTPSLTPTSGGGMSNHEDYLVREMNGMNLRGVDTTVGTIGYERPSNSRSKPNSRIGQERETSSKSAGPIGSQRPVNGHSYEDKPRNGSTSVPERQPRGPGGDWGGFSRPRQNGHANRGSGELDLNSFDMGWDDNRAQDSSDRNANGGSSQRF